MTTADCRYTGSIDAPPLNALGDAIAEARSRGWTTSDLSLDDALRAALSGGIHVSPTRRGEALVGLLRARERQEAHPLSLSARYGLEAFPLHSDGAHLRHPPDVVLLEMAGTSSGATLLLPLRQALRSTREEHALRQGVFQVGCGERSFYASALASDGSVRFDRCCMKPLDAEARFVCSWLEDAAVLAEVYRWEGVRTLVIDNCGCLHGRSAVAGHPNRSVRRLMLSWGSG